MLLIGVAVWQVILAVHVAAVVLTFGVTFAYPLIDLLSTRLDPRAMPWYYRTRVLVSQRLIGPGLVLVLVAGIYLASKLHQWSHFYTQWGLAVVVVIGGLGGAVLTPGERKLSALAERDIAAAGAGEVTWSGEYQALSKRLLIAESLVLVLVLVTVYLMTVHAG